MVAKVLMYDGSVSAREVFRAADGGHFIVLGLNHITVRPIANPSANAEWVVC